VIVTPAAGAHSARRSSSSRPPAISMSAAASSPVLPTARPGSRAHRNAGQRLLILDGSVPAGGKPIALSVSVDNPTLVLHARTARRADRGRHRRPGPGRGPRTTLATMHSTERLRHRSRRSAPRRLSTLAVRLMKISQNLYAENTAGHAERHDAGDRRGWPRSRAVGAHRLGRPRRRGDSTRRLRPHPLRLRDVRSTRGDSHARRSRRAAARAVRENRCQSPARSNGGTLANRMKGHAGRRERARQDRLDDERARQRRGYVTTADGEPLVFAILANKLRSARQRHHQNRGRHHRPPGAVPPLIDRRTRHKGHEGHKGQAFRQ